MRKVSMQVGQLDPTDWSTAPELLTVEEAAVLSRVAASQLYKLCRVEGFPSLRFGRAIRIHRDGFRRWLTSQFEYN